MKIEFAPMEGLTDSIYRKLHNEYFPGNVDVYYMPFFSPAIHRTLSKKEQRDLPPASSVPLKAVPQVLTRVPEDFLWAANVCRDLGYEEINLNAGCPSGTVVAKNKGAGMLRDVYALDDFLEAIFRDSPLPVSIKTRVGMENPEEFPRLLEIYNDYPIKELIIHPRVRKDFYKPPIHMECFEYALENSRNPVCYNGNLNTLSEIRAFQEKYPQVNSLMLGRGLIGDPGMLKGTDVKTLEAFSDELLQVYTDTFGSARNAMFRLKENWRYLLCHFDGGEKLGKKLRKTTDVEEYKAITHQIFGTLPFLSELSADW